LLHGPHMVAQERAERRRCLDRGEVTGPREHLEPRALAATYTVMETAPQLAALAIRVCGGLSLLKEHRLEQLYRDARCGSTMLPWSAEVCLDRLGRHGIFPGDA
ncbi:MAG: acyl-CoA dehydrogenase family protein, partial [Actinomycetota bacterium]